MFCETEESSPKIKLMKEDDPETLTIIIELEFEENKIGATFPCDLCSHIASTKDNLQKHLESVHEGIEYTQVCPFKASNSSVHIDIKKFKCDLCEYKAKRKDHLLKHVASIHKEQEYKCEKFSCNKCPFTASSKLILASHVTAVHKDIR